MKSTSNLKDGKTVRPAVELREAQAILAGTLRPAKPTLVALREALYRVAASPLTAVTPQPPYRQSLRDGFVLGRVMAAGGGEQVFRLAGEIAAGQPADHPLAPGEACRIMTGGLVPVGGERVIPQEACRRQDDRVMVPGAALQGRRTFIQEAGDEIDSGDVVVDAGTVLLPEHLAQLGAAGLEEVAVYARPRVGCFCTGSELVASPCQLQRGLKVSANGYLLAGLERLFGVTVDDLGIIADDSRALGELFAGIEPDRYDLLISTGGMGGGKYDLLHDIFGERGGEVLFGGLAMRPGKSTLFGRLQGSYFFGLPGPPAAVRTLLYVLVGPALLQLQGVGGTYPETVEALLQQPVEFKQRPVLQLRGGIAAVVQGQYRVRLATKREIPSCYLLVPPDTRRYAAGALVPVVRAATPFGGVESQGIDLLT